MAEIDESLYPNLTLHPAETSRTIGRTVKVLAEPFAGRLGGNQQFVLSGTEPNYERTFSRRPDAALHLTWKESFDLRGFTDMELWKQAIFEGWATSMLVFITGSIAIGLKASATQTSIGPLFPTIMVAITNLISLPLFIFAAAPVSGGHMNPLVTIATFAARLSTFPRTLLYILLQTLGATIGGFMIRAALGDKFSNIVVPGCSINTDFISPGEAFAFETMTSLCLIFLIFAVGLDPRQKNVLGPALGTFLCGLSLSLCNIASGFIKDGYSGAAMNPARCFGLIAAFGGWEYHYIHWLGPITGAVINAMFLSGIPPYKTWKHDV